MKSIFKVIIALSLVVFFITNPVQVSAAIPEMMEIQEINVTTEELADGITVLMTRNADGTYSQSVYSREESIVVPRAADDGVIDWAKFHLGFRNWENNCGDLYISVQSDEPMSKTSGTAYVKPTNALLSDYYNEKFAENLGSSRSTSRILALDINTGDATQVKVGFKYVIIWAISGNACAIPNESQVVTR